MIGLGQKSSNPLPYLIGLALFMLSIFTYLYWSGSPEFTSKIGSYIQVLTLIIFTITGIVTVVTFKHQNDDRARMMGIQYANMTQSKVADIDKMFINNPGLDRLYYQMYSHDPHIQQISKMKGPMKINPDILKLEHQASNLIFQKMADIYACEKLDDHFGYDCIEWINTFRSWMKSPILRSHWQYLKYEQHPEVRNFVEKYLIKSNKFITDVDDPKNKGKKLII